MTSRIPFLLFLLPAAALLGCPSDEGDDDSGSAGDDDDSATPEAHHTRALIGTTDFTVGALAEVALDTLEVTDEITATTGDSVVRVDGGYVIVINRFQHDSVRLYDPDDLLTPRTEFSAGAGSNPQEALLCAGRLFVTRLELDSIGVYDPESGLPVGDVDLTAWADDDGIPEAATMARVDDSLYVGLQRLDRDDAWLPAADGGRVVEVDCDTMEVARGWTTAPNVVVREHPRRSGALLLSDGPYWTADNLVATEGGVRELDLAEDEVGDYLLTEESLGGHIVGLVASASGYGLLVTAEDEGHRILCLDMEDWTTTELAFTSGWIPEVGVSDQGLAFVPIRGWIDPQLQGGVVVYDLQDCSNVTGDDWLRFSLDPFSVAFL